MTDPIDDARPYIDPIELRRNTAENGRLLKALITSLRHRARSEHDRRSARLLASKALIRSAGLEHTTELHLARLGTIDKRTLHATDQERLVDYLWSHGFLDGSHELARSVQAAPNAFSHALVHWMGVERRELVELGRLVSGRYRYWHPWRGTHRAYCVGALVFRSDPLTHAIHATQYAAAGLQGAAPGRIDVRDGYLIGDRLRLSGLLATRPENDGFFLALTGVRQSGGFTSLSGVVSGFVEGAPTAAPLYAERLAPEAGDAEASASIVPHDQVPWFARERLQQLSIGLGAGWGSRSARQPGPEDTDAGTANPTN